MNIVANDIFDKRCNEFNKEYLDVNKDLSAFNRLSTFLIKPIEKASKETHFLECRAGCTHCCYFRVEAFDFEIISIYLFLNEELEDKNFQKIKRKIKKQYELIKNLSPDERKYSANPLSRLIQYSYR